VGSAVEKVLASIGLKADEPPSAEGWSRLVTLLDERLAGDEAFWAAMDATESANRLKSEFLGVMSHELRTPLNGILGMAQLLRDTELDEERRDWVETILSSGESLLTIVNAILDFSKLEAGNLALVDGMIAPGTLAFDTMQLFAATAHQKSLRVACVVERGVPEVAGGDDRRMRQVLANLVGNAIKFTDTGHVVLRVRVRRAEGGDRLRFEVEDTGVGVEPAVQSRIFESFVQGDASETRRHGGTGLGLAIAKRLATLMDGELSFTTRVGAGSVFVFEVPLRSYDDDAPAAPPAKKPLRVLLLERIPAIGEAHRAALEALGFVVRVAGSVSEAKTLLERAEQPFELLFVDGSADADRAIEQCESLAAVAGAPPAFLLGPSGHSASATRTERARIAVVVHAPFRPEHLPRLEEAAEGVRHTLGRILASRPPPAPGARKRRALVVEDNAINQRVAVRTLERLGLEAVAVGNGRDALERLRLEAFDLVFMDCQMPLMNGYEATRRLRAVEPEGKHVPVIAMTAQSMPGDREKCLEAGMDDYVSKPLRLGEIEQKIAQWAGQA
jgi:two-component system sensor histidine kinase/response regulator